MNFIIRYWIITAWYIDFTFVYGTNSRRYAIISIIFWIIQSFEGLHSLWKFFFINDGSCSEYTETCQPIVGLCNRALLGSRPVNNSRPNTHYATIEEAVFSPCHAEPNHTVRCYTTGRDDVTQHHARFRGNAVVNTVTWRNRVDWLCFSFRWFRLYKRG
jgi:hypothetical protein